MVTTHIHCAADQKEYPVTRLPDGSIDGIENVAADSDVVHGVHDGRAFIFTGHEIIGTVAPDQLWALLGSPGPAEPHPHDLEAAAAGGEDPRVTATCLECGAPCYCPVGLDGGGIEAGCPMHDPPAETEQETIARDQETADSTRVTNPTEPTD